MGEFMTDFTRLGAFVSELCGTLASFERPRLDLVTLPDGTPAVVVASASHHKVGSVRRLALARGLDVQNVEGLLITPLMTVTVPCEPETCAIARELAETCPRCGATEAELWIDLPIDESHATRHTERAS
jgi:hypothetical protein